MPKSTLFPYKLYQCWYQPGTLLPSSKNVLKPLVKKNVSVLSCCSNDPNVFMVCAAAKLVATKAALQHRKNQTAGTCGPWILLHIVTNTRIVIFFKVLFEAAQWNVFANSTYPRCRESAVTLCHLSTRHLFQLQSAEVSCICNYQLVQAVMPGCRIDALQSSSTSTGNDYISHFSHCHHQRLYETDVFGLAGSGRYVWKPKLYSI